MACLSSSSAADASSSVQYLLQQLQHEFQQKMDQMQMEINELKSTSAIPKSGKSNVFVTYDIFYRFLSKDKIG